MQDPACLTDLHNMAPLPHADVVLSEGGAGPPADDVTGAIPLFVPAPPQFSDTDPPVDLDALRRACTLPHMNERELGMLQDGDRSNLHTSCETPLSSDNESFSRGAVPPTSWDSVTLRGGSPDNFTPMNNMGGTSPPALSPAGAELQPPPLRDSSSDYDADSEEDGPARHNSSRRRQGDDRPRYIVPARRQVRTRTGRVSRLPAHLKDYVLLSRVCPPVQ